ncbi:MAG: DUF2125 domain-containing protein [Paracoccaceae bacterium]
MKHWKLAGSTAAAALLAGNAALAQVTPEDVWQSWQDMSTSFGQTITTTSVAREGETLVVSGYAVLQDQDGMKVDARIEELNFTDLGDGTVEITMSETYVMNMTTPPVEGIDGSQPTNMTITVSQPEMVTIASGTPENTSYAVGAPSVSVKLEASEPGDAGVNVVGDFTMTTLAGNYTVEGPADAKVMGFDISVENLAMNMAVSEPAQQSNLQMVGSIADLQAAYAFDLKGMAMMETNVAEALKAGTSIGVEMTHGAVDFTIDVTDPAGPSKILAASNGGGVDVQMDAAGLVYGITGLATALTISGPEIPFPEMKLNYGEIAFNLEMPLLASAESTDFAFLTRVVDLTVSDELWAMVDPTGSLPRDPATVVVDTKGRARLTVDIVDEAAMAALGEAPPGEIESLEVAEIKATVAGAALTGAGAFTFDNTDIVTFDGVPAPTGKLDLKLLGGNVLLDKLVGMGLLTEEDAGGARMMMSMFANAGPGEDELNSTLEFKDKGFYANGQRLQ